jgi:Heterokaryon incompatibility protein (HET)
MDPDNVYKYERITAEDTIRLILLQPSEDLEASIDCSLVCVTLEQCDKDVVEHYVALSYVWGDATVRRQISVDGARMGITASLDCALRHLRDASRTLRVWADGICINQDDFGDRNQQVRMMSSIYSLAHHTIIFLGPRTPHSDTVMRFLASQDHRSDKPKRIEGSAESLFYGGLKTLVEECILSNAWFTRVWVLQELVLSADPWVQCGRTRVRWRTLSDLVLSSTSSVWSPESRKHLSAMNDARSKFNKPKEDNNDFGPGIPLLDLLRDRRASGVSDPKDMIYGHLSLTDLKTQAAIPIRYDLSVAEIYQSLAQQYIVWTGDISVLFEVEDLEFAERRDNLPSWVPDVRITII